MAALHFNENYQCPQAITASGGSEQIQNRKHSQGEFTPNAVPVP